MRGVVRLELFGALPSALLNAAGAEGIALHCHPERSEAESKDLAAAVTLCQDPSASSG